MARHTKNPRLWLNLPHTMKTTVAFGEIVITRQKNGKYNTVVTWHENPFEKKFPDSASAFDLVSKTIGKAMQGISEKGAAQ